MPERLITKLLQKSLGVRHGALEPLPAGFRLLLRLSHPVPPVSLVQSLVPSRDAPRFPHWRVQAPVRRLWEETRGFRKRRGSARSHLPLSSPFSGQGEPRGCVGVQLVAEVCSVVVLLRVRSRRCPWWVAQKWNYRHNFGIPFNDLVDSLDGCPGKSFKSHNRSLTE